MRDGVVADGRADVYGSLTTTVVRVSVVLPTHGRPDLLGRAIASVRDQAFEGWELIVVDDNQPGSAARRETEAHMARLRGDGRVRYLRHAANLGGGAARNTGIRASRGSLVAFLDDDDEWDRRKLELQVACLDTAPPGVAAAYCRVRIVNTRTGRVRRYSTPGGSPTVRELLIRNQIGSTSSVVCKRSALEEVGMFDETLPARQDVDLYVRLAERYSFCFVDAPLVNLYLHGGPSIGTDYEASIEAHRRFWTKYRHGIDNDPEVAFSRLRELGRLLMWARQHHEAREVLLRAWRIRPTSWEMAARIALTSSLFRTVSYPVLRFFRHGQWRRSHDG